MTILVFLPEGKAQEYPNASGLRVENGLTTFYYEPDKKKKVTTTLPILFEEDAGTPRISSL
jgi:hypothetical protein